LFIDFLVIFKDYLIDVLPYLAVGFLLSGVINEFVPSGWVEKHLGGSGIRPLLYATLAGTILPVCCIGSLPIAISLHQKGARLGPVMAFLVATPATSISALLVTYGLLGLKFTIYIFFAVIIMGLIMGIISNRLHAPSKAKGSQPETATCPTCGGQVETKDAPTAERDGETYYFCCSHCKDEFEENDGATGSKIRHRLKHVFRYAFVDMVKDIGPELLLGLVLAAVVAAITPIGEFIGNYLDGGYAYPIALVFGLAMYICSTASVPLVHALLSQGMNIGAGMLLLLVGPITSWSTILIVRRQFGGRILLVYMVVISALALTLGFIYSII
jgi:uncharacterized membrane protein YraQ (UPF0718 family)